LKVNTFTGHTDSVNTIFVSNNYLYSGSRDAKLIKWEVDSGEIVWHKYMGNAIVSLFVENHIVYCGVVTDSFSKLSDDSGILLMKARGISIGSYHSFI
jgi:WD40 repeat protein